MLVQQIVIALVQQIAIVQQIVIVLVQQIAITVFIYTLLYLSCNNTELSISSSAFGRTFQKLKRVACTNECQEISVFQ